MQVLLARACQLPFSLPASRRVVHRPATPRPTPSSPMLLTQIVLASPPIAGAPQVPHLDASAAARLSLKRRGVLQSLRGLAISGLEQVRMALGMTPGYLPLVGAPGSLAMMQLDEFETAEYFSKHPKVYQVSSQDPRAGRQQCQGVTQQYAWRSGVVSSASVLPRGPAEGMVL